MDCIKTEFACKCLFVTKKERGSKLEKNNRSKLLTRAAADSASATSMGNKLTATVPRE